MSTFGFHVDLKAIRYVVLVYQSKPLTSLLKLEVLLL